MKSKAITLIEALEPRTLLSVSLVKDINTAPGPLLGVWDMKTAGDVVYLGAEDSTAGWELYKSDGTTAGTTLVKDIRPGRDNSQVSWLTYDAGQGIVYFTADDGVHGDELWKSDGTADGTVMVKDINPGVAASTPSGLLMVGDTLYFSANNGTNGTELWKSDGTDAGTVMVKDIYAGSGSSGPGQLIDNSGTLFFRATDPGNGAELWKSDGTAAGTVLVKNIYPFSSSGVANVPMATMNGLVYFVGNNSSTGTELYQSDGTDAGTVMVKDITAGSANTSISGIKTSGSYLYFNVSSVPNAGVWRTDGTAAGTVQIAAGSVVNSADAGGTLVFGMGTTLYAVIGSGYTTVKPNLTMSNSQFWTSLNGSLWFEADDGSGTGGELWTSDGTGAGTHLVKDINPGPADGAMFLPTALNGQILFNAQTADLGWSLWKTDGTDAGTQLVKDIYTATGDSGPLLLTPYHGELYFAAYVPGVGSTGGELYRSDGTEAGTNLVIDLNPGAPGANISNLRVFGDYLYFSATNGSTGKELWRTDGTAAGTTLVADINPGAGDSSPFDLTVSGNYLYFAASTPTNGLELWRTDGTAGGTIRLTDITAGAAGSDIEIWGESNGTAYFTASNGSLFAGLWQSNGTPGTTSLYSNAFTSISGARNINGTLYLAATASSTGSELFRIDPGAPGPVLVKDIFSGSNSSSPQYLTDVGDTLYFAAATSANGRELWKSDGTSAGTVMVKDINPGFSGGISSVPFAGANGVVYFRADDGKGAGAQLWRSDGTAGGTFMVKAITPPGGNFVSPTRLYAANGFLYFAADDGTNGVEAWRSDGTADGTAMLADLYPEGDFIFFPSNAAFFTEVGTDVFYRYTDDNHGSELWKSSQPDFAVLGENGALTISGTGGDDVITLANEPGGLVVTLNGMTQTFAAGAVSSISFGGHGGRDFLDLTGGTITFANDIGADTPNLAVRIGAGVAAIFDSTQHIANLQINGGNASISPGGSKVLVVDQFSIASGSLDLSDNDLIVRGGAIGTWDGNAYDGVSGSIQSGTIISSTAQSRRTTLGIATAASLFNITGSQTGTFDGQTVSPGDVLVKFTYAGDANLDGKVNIDDYGRIDSNVGQSGVVFGWYNGDFNFDGKINIDDYGLIDSIIGAQGPVL